MVLLRIFTVQGLAVCRQTFTVDSRYLDFGYLEEKIWSLFKHRNLTSGNKILWIRGKIAPQEQFLPFSTIL